MSYNEKLGISSEEFENLFEYFESREYDGIDYYALPDIRKGIEKGTVLVNGEIIRGYPKTPRVFMLIDGIKSYFQGDIVVEEKMDGYNLRIAKIDKKILAFTRSGYICPFSTYKVKQKLNLETFFSEYEDYMLCGEMIGPENPYTSHDYSGIDSLDIQIFDIKERTSGNSLPVKKRRELCSDFDINQVRSFGIYSIQNISKKLYRIIDKLENNDREGIVIKSLDGEKQLKYTTKNTHQGDLSYAFSLPFDYGQDFVFSRIIREAFQSVEWDENYNQAKNRAQELGESILLPFINSIRNVQKEKTIGEYHTIRGKPDKVTELLEYFRDQGLSIRIEKDYIRKDQRVVLFVKESHSTTDKIKNYLQGGTKDL